MAIHLVRHATAGSRPDWHQPDDLRPLTNGGLVQASTIAAALDGRPIERVLSSRYVRCTQTVQPVADAVGVDVETHPALAEEASIEQTWALFEELAAGDAEVVVCSHGNVIPPLLDRLRHRGVELVSDEWSCHKGSIWTVEVADGRAVRAVQTLARA
jgi:8-oxo-dGTP diphosphatase